MGALHSTRSFKIPSFQDIITNKQHFSVGHSKPIMLRSTVPKLSKLRLRAKRNKLCCCPRFLELQDHFARYTKFPKLFSRIFPFHTNPYPIFLMESSQDFLRVLLFPFTLSSSTSFYFVYSRENKSSHECASIYFDVIYSLQHSDSNKVTHCGMIEVSIGRRVTLSCRLARIDLFGLYILFSQYRSCDNTQEAWSFVFFIKKSACRHIHACMPSF